MLNVTPRAFPICLCSAPIPPLLLLPLNRLHLLPRLRLPPPCPPPPTPPPLAATRPPQSSLQAADPAASCHLHLFPPLLPTSPTPFRHPSLHPSLPPLPPSTSPLQPPPSLIVAVKQLADVTFNYGRISSGARRAGASRPRHSQQKEELHYNLP